MNHHVRGFPEKMYFKIALELLQIVASSDGAFQSLAAVTENDLEPYLASL